MTTISYNSLKIQYKITLKINEKILCSLLTRKMKTKNTNCGPLHIENWPNLFMFLWGHWLMEILFVIIIWWWVWCNKECACIIYSVRLCSHCFTLKLLHMWFMACTKMFISMLSYHQAYDCPTNPKWDNIGRGLSTVIAYNRNKWKF